MPGKNIQEFVCWYEPWLKVSYVSLPLLIPLGVELWKGRCYQLLCNVRLPHLTLHLHEGCLILTCKDYKYTNIYILPALYN